VGRSRKLLISNLTQRKRHDKTVDFRISYSSHSNVLLVVIGEPDVNWHENRYYDRQAINLLVMITLFEMVMAIGLGMTRSGRGKVLRAAHRHADKGVGDPQLSCLRNMPRFKWQELPGRNE
jgi:hypothetical protein